MALVDRFSLLEARGSRASAAELALWERSGSVRPGSRRGCWRNSERAESVRVLEQPCHARSSSGAAAVGAVRRGAAAAGARHESAGVLRALRAQRRGCYRGRRQIDVQAEALLAVRVCGVLQRGMPESPLAAAQTNVQSSRGRQTSKQEPQKRNGG